MEEKETIDSDEHEKHPNSASTGSNWDREIPVELLDSDAQPDNDNSTVTVMASDEVVKTVEIAFNSLTIGHHKSLTLRKKVICTPLQIKFAIVVDTVKEIRCCFNYADLTLFTIFTSVTTNLLMLVFKPSLAELIRREISPVFDRDQDDNYRAKTKAPAFAIFENRDVDSATDDPGTRPLVEPISNKRLIIGWASKKTHSYDLNETDAMVLYRKLRDAAPNVRQRSLRLSPKATADGDNSLTGDGSSRIADILIEAGDSDESDRKSESDETIMVYPRHACSEMGQVTITSRDLRCLANHQFLNDIIIGFYCRYLWTEGSIPEAQKKRYSIFDSLFFDKLTLTSQQIKSNPTKRNERLASLRRWVKSVNFKEKDFLLLPCNKHCHWFLVIICFPCLLFDDCDREQLSVYSGSPRPSVILLDSLNQLQLGDSLACFAKDCPPESGVFNDGGLLTPIILEATKTLSECIGNVTVDWYYQQMNVPNQLNFTDCGLFVLEYIRRFLDLNPLMNFSMPLPDLTDWFKPSDLRSTRRHIKTLINAVQKQQP